MQFPSTGRTSIKDLYGIASPDILQKGLHLTERKYPAFRSSARLMNLYGGVGKSPKHGDYEELRYHAETGESGSISFNN